MTNLQILGICIIIILLVVSIIIYDRNAENFSSEMIETVF